MRRLILMRHAKAHRDDPAGDRARALTEIGRADAKRAGAWLAAEAFEPDLALVSDARRTRETMERLMPALARPPHLRVDPKLYLAEPPALLRAIRAAPPEARTVLLVAHKPGVAELALALTGAGDAQSVARLAHSFPTGSLAVLACDDPWARMKEAGARLERFVTARDLRAR